MHKEEKLIFDSKNDEPSLVLPNGTQIWHKNNKKHREKNPAVITHDGTKMWYINDEFYREDDQPTIEWADGTKEWYLGSVLHREKKDENGETLPAVIYPSGEKHWYINGILGRPEDLPSIIGEDGTMIWIKNGKKHRICYPAVIFPNGTKEWYIEGKHYREDEKGNLLPSIVYPDGRLEYYENGKKIENVLSHKRIIQPSEQYAQKCPYCGHFITMGQPTEIYSGDAHEFQGWKCHFDRKCLG